MSCKLKCPKCKKILKESGDEMKKAEGEYLIFDSLENSNHQAATYRLIECLECNHSAKVNMFSDL